MQLMALTFALASTDARAEQPNVIVVLVDTLRADHLEPYGYGKSVSPRVASWAEDAVVFENAISQNAWTVPSVASLLSGMYPRAHQCLDFQEGATVEMDTLSPDQDMVAEQFQAAGYTTAAIVKTKVIAAERGFGQGFDSYTFVPGSQAWGPAGKELTDASIAFLEKQGDQPFFLYLHYMDPHSPYQAPDEYYEKYVSSNGSTLTGAHEEVKAFKTGGAAATEADIERLYALYDGEIAYWDQHFGRLLDALDALGMADTTVVVLTADHGEQFGEHGGWFHEHLYQENIHVPLAISAPGAAGARVATRVQQMDVAPTVASLAGVKHGTHWQGRDLSPAMSGGETPAGDTYAEYAHKKTLISADGFKIILGEGGDLMFDLNKDPGETTNIVATEAAKFAELQARLIDIFKSSQAMADKFSAAQTQQLGDDDVEALRALGYIE